MMEVKDMRLKGKRILVTGATKGIGRGVARMAAREGALVALTGRDEAQGRAAEAEIRAGGGTAFFIPGDLLSADACFRVVDEARNKLGGLDGLVNNAGVFPHIPLMETDEKTFDAVMAINAKAPFFLTQRALRHMTQSGGGSIVNIGSTHWYMGAASLPVYSMSKGALHTLTQHVSQHFAAQGVRCNWVTVGWVLSPGEIKRHLEDGHDQAWISNLAKEYIPLGNFQTEEDIAYACVYLLSDEARQVTGTDIGVTGGFKPERY